MDHFHHRLWRRRWGLERHFNPHQLAGHLLAQMGHQTVEEVKGLLLIFIQRIALRIATPANHLAKMVERNKMLTPEMIQRLEQHLLFDISHHIRRIFLDPPCIGLIRRRAEPLAQLFIRNTLFLRPIGNRKIEAKRF